MGRDYFGSGPTLPVVPKVGTSLLSLLRQANTLSRLRLLEGQPDLAAKGIGNPTGFRGLGVRGLGV